MEGGGGGGGFRPSAHYAQFVSLIFNRLFFKGNYYKM